VIVGHRDSATGPAVFYELRQLTRGDRIDIERSDGSTAMFRVTRAETHHKDQFPTKRVYGNTRLPTLRLITCTGSYDAGSGYRDNLIVFAEATGGR
jgi:sortase (surface protein transpeptidase)